MSGPKKGYSDALGFARIDILTHYQDTSVGTYYFQRQWHLALTTYIATVEKEETIARMLKRPATRECQPIIEPWLSYTSILNRPG